VLFHGEAAPPAASIACSPSAGTDIMNDTPPRTDQTALPDPTAESLPLHVEREGEDSPLSQHDSETAAEGAALRDARVTGTPEVVIHDRYGRVHRAEPWTGRSPDRA
jgi:hypothetical protein